MTDFLPESTPHNLFLHVLHLASSEYVVRVPKHFDVTAGQIAFQEVDFSIESYELGNLSFHLW